MTLAADPISNNRRLDWLVDNLTRTVPGVTHATLVSADGVKMAASAHLPGERAEQLTAITAGLASLAIAAADLADGGSVRQTVLEMNAGFLFLMSVGDGSHLAVLASRSCDLGQVGYEMAVLVDRVGRKVDAAARGTV